MSVVSSLMKIFLGDKSAKDVKKITPSVNNVNKFYASLHNLSNDELRKLTDKFKEKIRLGIENEENNLIELQKKAEEEKKLNAKEELYKKIDLKKKDIISLTEEILTEIKDEAFAVLKETARRFTENEELEVSAKSFDIELSGSNDFVEVEGDKAYWKNNWNANGTPIEWNMIHYDVQLIGGNVLHQGKIAEMKTGEGKTLVSTLPIYLNALSGKGVHVVTVNDYLAKRDSKWMGPIFQFHGLSVDCIDNYEPHSDERKKAYNSDITYGTNNEFGFDYLRDNMSKDKEDIVQREHNFAIIDEVDSVLVDDARTPLIISGSTKQNSNKQLAELNPFVQKIFDIQRRELSAVLNESRKLIIGGDDKQGGELLLRAYRGLPKNKALIKFLSEDGIKSILQKTENIFMQENSKRMPEIDKHLLFTIDEKNKGVELTDKGIEELSKGTEGDFFIMPDISVEIGEIDKLDLSDEEKIKKKDTVYREFSIKSERIHLLNQLLKAYTLFEKDIEYVVIDSQVKIVDEQTGRIMDGRRYSDGLHQALESKENVKVQASSQTLATITLQNYFRMYNKLAGMTGTAVTEAGEFWEIYKLDVVEIPTNKPVIRKDENDLVYRTKREKYNAVILQIQDFVKQGRPVLVGTTSVEISETLSKALSLRKIKHNVLNAKLHKKEADIVAEAGKYGVVTIATNMAGRGTDIKLSDEVKEAGGLAIVGTEKHDSRRVDRQLRGRSGRQGDPGSSQFYISLEDDLMRLFGSEKIIKIMNRIGLKEGEVIQHGMITNSIERAQKKVEENNFGIRKRLLDYDNVMNSQREIVYKRRKNALYGERLYFDIITMIYESCEDIVIRNKSDENYDNFMTDVITTFSVDSGINKDTFSQSENNELIKNLFQNVYEHYKFENEQKIKKTFPLIKNLYEGQEEYKNAVIPFTDGIKSLNIIANIEKVYASEGKSIVTDFEKSVVLSIIDNKWKDHLRNMDDLRQSVQNVVYQQKDPLLIYKFEAFEIFKSMMLELNKEVISFLIKAQIPMDVQNHIRRASKSSPKQSYDESRGSINDGRKPKEKTEPVKREMPKIGRNDKVKIQNIQTGEISEMKFKQAIPKIENGECVLVGGK